MAAILKPGGSVVSSAPAGSSTPPAGAATDLFTQLIAAMVTPQGAPPAQGNLPFQDLASLGGAFPLEGEMLELTGDEPDTDTEIADEDEAALAALAMLLPSLPQAMPEARVEEELVQAAAIEELTGDECAETESSTAAPSPVETRGTANLSAPAHMHAMLATHTTQHADAVPDGTLQAPVGSPQWKDELGTQLTWMAINGREAASLKLSPAELGPLDIRISVREGEASVYFGAANADTRSALEQSLPRLRELFAAQGLVLADANVSRDAPRNAFKPSPHGEGSRSLSDASSEASVSSVTLTRAGLIDTYV